MGIIQPLLQILLFAAELVGHQKKSLKRFRQRLQLQALLRLRDHGCRRHSAFQATMLLGYERFICLQDNTSAKAEAQFDT